MAFNFNDCSIFNKKTFLKSSSTSRNIERNALTKFMATRTEVKRWIDRGNFFFSINKKRFIKSLKKQKLLSLGAVENSNKNIVLDSVLMSLFYFCENLRELI